MAGPGPTGSASEQAERSMARLFVAARCCAAQLSFSTLMVIGDRRRFGRPGVQFAVLALATAESAWLTRRILTAGRFRDRRGMWGRYRRFSRRARRFGRRARHRRRRALDEKRRHRVSARRIFVGGPS